MTAFCLNNFDPESFLKDYWQKQPLLLNEALLNFESPLTADELAGLSLDPDIESRIVQQMDNDEWLLRHGPFDEKTFELLGKSPWTLLVQAVDQWLDEVAELKHLFDFIPSWRLDDIMISFAPEGGSVGPHFDQYDVFLIQAAGSRRWLLGQHCDDQTPLIDNDLKLLQEFEKQEEHLLQPGDILYIPPGKAHWGISESNDCMTISIGFRAPSHEDIIDRFCDEICQPLDDDERYQDPDLVKQFTDGHPSEISHNVLKILQDTLKQHLNNKEAMVASFGKLMTETRYEQDDCSEYLPDTLYIKRLDARMAYFKTESSLQVFANGESFLTPLDQELFIQSLCDTKHIETTGLTQDETDIIKLLIFLCLYEQAEE